MELRSVKTFVKMGFNTFFMLLDAIEKQRGQNEGSSSGNETDRFEAENVNLLINSILIIWLWWGNIHMFMDWFNILISINARLGDCKLKTQKEQIKSWLTNFLLPIIIVICIGGFLYYKSPDLLAPVLTPLVAFVAFLGQQHQLRLQKEDSSLNRFTGTFFQLIEIHNNNVQDLKYEDPVDGKIYQGRYFLKKAYHDLMVFYHDAVKRQEGKPFKESMEKLDQTYNDNLHLYFKNLKFIKRSN